VTCFLLYLVREELLCNALCVVSAPISISIRIHSSPGIVGIFVGTPIC